MNRRTGMLETMFSSFAEFRGDYEAAKSNRFRSKLTGVEGLGGGADYHYRNESQFFKLMELARSFDRNDGVVGQGVTRVVDNVLQGGMTYDPTTGDDGLNTALKELWKDWSEDEDQCHSEGEENFHGLSKLVLRHMLIDGDIFSLPLHDGTLEMKEAHRVKTPRGTKRNVVHGVLMDDHRKRQEYWFTKVPVGITQLISLVGEMKPVPARDKDGNRQVFHVYNPKRLSQTRGVTVCAPIMDFVGFHDDIQFAKMVQQQTVSCFGFIRERSGNPAFNTGNLAATGETTEEILADGTVRQLEGIAPGMELIARPGETIKAFSPAVPNAEFFEHAMLILQIIAINLGLPLQVLLLDARQTNFSGWRGAMDQARTGFRELQGLMKAKWYRRVLRWKVRQWALSDSAIRSAGDKAFLHDWKNPSWPYIDPAKDAKADNEAAGGRMNSRRRLVAQRGMDLDDLDTEIIDDTKSFIKRAIKAAAEINKEFSEALVDWREVALFDGKVERRSNFERPVAGEDVDEEDGDDGPAKVGSSTVAEGAEGSDE